MIIRYLNLEFCKQSKGLGFHKYPPPKGQCRYAGEVLFAEHEQLKSGSTSWTYCELPSESCNLQSLEAAVLYYARMIYF